jgi:hypothetical protein
LPTFLWVPHSSRRRPVSLTQNRKSHRAGLCLLSLRPSVALAPTPAWACARFNAWGEVFMVVPGRCRQRVFGTPRSFDPFMQDCRSLPPAQDHAWVYPASGQSPSLCSPPHLALALARLTRRAVADAENRCQASGLEVHARLLDTCHAPVHIAGAIARHPLKPLSPSITANDVETALNAARDHRSIFLK